MAVIAIHGADDFDFMEEMAQRIAEAKRDAARLRQRPSLEEVIEIMERSRAGLEELMERDPTRAEKIRAFLEASAQRIRKIVLDHRRKVRQHRATYNSRSELGALCAGAGREQVVGQSAVPSNYWKGW
jgi:hypothetical protein